MLTMKWNGKTIKSIGFCQCGAVQMEYVGGGEEHASREYFDSHGGDTIMNAGEWYACNHCVNGMPIVYGTLNDEENEDETL